MIAVDTNILVRIITNDDARQAALAADLLNRREVFISKTVLLETEWVLRSAYKFGRLAVLEALRRFLDRSNVEIEDEATFRHALDWNQQGMDFADAMHLASAGNGRDFLTFDADLIRTGRHLRLRVAGVA